LVKQPRKSALAAIGSAGKVNPPKKSGHQAPAIHGVMSSGRSPPASRKR